MQFKFQLKSYCKLSTGNSILNFGQLHLPALQEAKVIVAKTQHAKKMIFFLFCIFIICELLQIADDHITYHSAISV